MADNSVLWLTAAFIGARSDRPALYYLDPLKLRSKEILDAGQLFRVWTWPRSYRVVSSIVPEECIGVCDLDEVTREHWNRDEWFDSIAERHLWPWSIEVRHPELMEVWLAKLPLLIADMERTGAEVGVWFDVGYQISHLCNHSYDEYVKRTPHHWHLEHAKQALLEATEETGCLWFGRQPTTGDVMTAISDKFLGGAFFALRRDRMHFVMDEAKVAWRKILDTGKISTDEPALALAAWKNNWPVWSFEQWMEIFGSERT